MTESLKMQDDKKIFDIIHSQDFDFIINSELSETEKVALLEEFKDGLPQSYQEYLQPGNFLNSGARPVLFVKQRLLSSTNLQRFRTGQSLFSYSPQEMNASLSLANEFTIAKKIAHILDSDEAQEYAHSVGFDSISVVRPLLGIISKVDAKKYMVYSFIEGVSWSKFDKRVHPEDHDKVEGLLKLFKQHGTNPTDLVAKQIMIHDNKMFLIDMELYHRAAA